MKILGIDSSAKSASVAVVDNGKILSSFYINTGLTHSQTLMPMLENALECSGVKLKDIDLIAVNVGPGSFTGIRIGVAAAKGLADTLNIKVCPVSTLESMAYNLVQSECIAAAVMDARCSQVYTSLFRIKDGVVERITDDNALLIDQLADVLSRFDEEIVLVGDGADLCYKAMSSKISNLKIATEAYKYQNASSVCFAAQNVPEENYLEGKDIVPEYLRLPQAERELINKRKGELK